MQDGLKAFGPLVLLQMVGIIFYIKSPSVPFEIALLLVSVLWLLVLVKIEAMDSSGSKRRRVRKQGWVSLLVVSILVTMILVVSLHSWHHH